MSEKKDTTKKVVNKKPAKKVQPKPVEKVETKKAKVNVVEAKKVETKKVETKKAEPKKEDVKKVEVKINSDADVINKQADKEIKKAMKKNNPGLVIGIVCAILVVAVIGILCWFFSREAYKPLATYAGGEITKAEYEPYYKIFKDQLSTYFGEDKAEELKQYIAKKVAMDERMNGLAKKAKLTLTDKEKAEIKAQIEVPEMKEQIKKFGVAQEQIQKILESDALIAKYVQTLKEQLPEDKVNAFLAENYKDADLNKYISRHILFKTKDEAGADLDPTKKAEIKTKANAILNRALSGEDFAALATEFSEDTASGVKGGVIEFVDDGQLIAEYSNAAKALQPGQVSGALVESSFGFHIIKLDSVEPRGRVIDIKDQMLDDVYAKIEEEAKIVLNNESIATFAKTK
ncbi:MAG: peptidylprolyl isomerase [Clostridia bacterium]